MLIIFPFLLLQKEIEVHGNAIRSGLSFTDKIGHLFIHIVTSCKHTFHITAEKGKVHLLTLQFVFLEITFLQQMLAQVIVHDFNGIYIVVHVTPHPTSVTLLHAYPVLERLIDERLGRDSNDGIIEVTHLDRGKRHIFHITVHPRLFHRNPVAFVKHVIRGQTNACHQSGDSILKDKKEYCRQSAQSGKE